MIRHCISAKDFDRDLLESLFHQANKFREGKMPGTLLRASLSKKTLVTLFYEPSTRTRLSFESAMLRLGGRVLSVESARESSSVAKGESVEDTVRTLQFYGDAIVMRHSEEGSAARAVTVSRVPIINGGDGKGEHPSQTLLDLYTIQQELETIDGLKIAMVGDLASGRTVKSLSYGLCNFQGVEISFVSPEHLRMSPEVVGYLRERGIKNLETGDFDGVLPDVDIVYMTRIQKERMSLEDYEGARGKFIMDERRLNIMRPDARVMHPLPHVEEINLPVGVEEKDQRVAYFRQVENGVYARMALLRHLLKDGHFSS